jgi:hypothetical protein
MNTITSGVPILVDGDDDTAVSSPYWIGNRCYLDTKDHGVVLITRTEINWPKIARTVDQLRRVAFGIEGAAVSPEELRQEADDLLAGYLSGALRPAFRDVTVAHLDSGRFQRVEGTRYFYCPETSQLITETSQAVVEAKHGFDPDEMLRIATIEPKGGQKVLLTGLAEDERDRMIETCRNLHLPLTLIYTNGLSVVQKGADSWVTRSPRKKN